MFYKNLNIEDLPNEIWVDMFGFDGIYEVSNLGRIKSPQREINTRWGTPRIKKEIILKQSIIKKSTGRVDGLIITIDKSRNSAPLIFKSFYPEIEFEENECIMHINKNALDNRIENLKKVTRKISKNTDMKKSFRTILATPLNLSKAIEVNKEFYDNRTHKQCNVCEKTLSLELFVVGHNECKKCHNISMKKKREIFVEKRIEKKCSKCLEIKKIELFPKHNKVYCKKCSNEYALKRRQIFNKP